MQKIVLVGYAKQYIALVSQFPYVFARSAYRQGVLHRGK